MTMLEPAKGVRDFYPEDERVQKYIFAAMRRVAESFGYEEMNASVLEPTELYTAKTSEEIVGKQTYTFKDRGGRSITLRPEMTPSVARMVAARKRELGFPLRWYSIQNFFRYERPQRGRLREFWQLNADLFGVSGIEADTEIIEIAYRVMRALKARESDFVIRIASREFLERVYDTAKIPKERRGEMTRLLDAQKLDDPRVQGVLKVARAEKDSFAYFTLLERSLHARGVGNAVIDLTVARGFDYYTGMVFEVFDTNPANPRSLFGGGRYDNLIEQYLPAPKRQAGRQVASAHTPAVGFAMGDVITRDFLETHGLLPALQPATRLYLAPVTENDAPEAAALAQQLRESGLTVALGMEQKKIADHIKAAVKLRIPYFTAYGEKEKTSGVLTIKELATQKEREVATRDAVEYLLKI